MTELLYTFYMPYIYNAMVMIAGTFPYYKQLPYHHNYTTVLIIISWIMVFSYYLKVKY